MRKVKFIIDDKKYFMDKYKEDSILQEVIAKQDSFQAVYTLIEGGTIPDKYELTDYNGNKININTLNGYQRGVILSDCDSYFEGRKYFSGATKPIGVISIEETEE